MYSLMPIFGTMMPMLGAAAFFDNPQLWLILCFPFSCILSSVAVLLIVILRCSLSSRRDDVAVYLVLAVNEYIEEMQ